MRPLTIFQRSVLAFMYQVELTREGKQCGINRRAIEYALQVVWQTHYSNAMLELQELGWLHIRNYWGKHEYVLSHRGREQMEANIHSAMRHTRITSDQRKLVD